MNNLYKNYVKRSLDLALSLVLFICFFPLMIIIATLVFSFVSKDFLFRQKRPGKNEKIFTIYKFKTMTNERDNNGELLSDELRLKGFGKILRKTSLDELPQLFNVLIGDMSFVGPRPLLVEYLDYYNENEKHRHDVRPGITGLAQVNGRNAISWEQKFALDLNYVRDLSLSLDLKIILLTIKKVFLQKDVNSSTHATMQRFKR